ncbi:hypothetical protein OESDEN_12763 [Oesophagostomum dentatum]|uniref:SCP domain-containing protein n=1 Tax=Oesophagostomum dentatum TaxID=61180 RepID=A0A0B1SR80_OESDE|nr:hypothetical protein OESDEN_12763 [Oesophagostomum dentatum]
MDINWTEPTLYTGVLDWLKEIQDEPLTYDSDAIRYSEPSKHRNYLNLMRRSITKMGCGGMYCYEDGMHKYRGLCLTNKP